MRQSIRYVLMLAVLLGAPAPAGGKASRPARLTGLIVYWSGSPYPSIWAVRPDGTHNRRILHNQQNAKRPRLSPDRVWVAFDGASPGKAPMTDFDIQVVRVDGTGRQTLTRNRLKRG
jgi:Tol biopolymer transport system component